MAKQRERVKLVHGVRAETIVPHGSDAHKAIVGLIDTKDPQARANLEEQMRVPLVVAENKRPINRQEYGPHEEIFDGWSRQGR